MAGQGTRPRLDTRSRHGLDVARYSRRAHIPGLVLASQEFCASDHAILPHNSDQCNLNLARSQSFALPEYHRLSLRLLILHAGDC